MVVAISRARKANRVRGWSSGSYGDGRAPRPCPFLCSEMNFRQITFSETELPVKTIRKAPIDLDLKPQKSTKRFEKALFRCFGGQEWRGQRLLWPLFGQFRMRGSRKLKGKEKEDRSGDLLLCGGTATKKAGALEEPRSAKRVSLLPVKPTCSLSRRIGSCRRGRRHKYRCHHRR